MQCSGLRNLLPDGVINDGGSTQILQNLRHLCQRCEVIEMVREEVEKATILFTGRASACFFLHPIAGGSPNKGLTHKPATKDMPADNAGLARATGR